MFGLAVCVAALGWNPAAVQMGYAEESLPRPNVLLILVEDLG